MITAVDPSTGVRTAGVGDSTNNAIRINCITGCAGGNGGTSAADKATFTVGTTSGTPMMGAVAPVDTVVAGTVAIAALDTARNLKINCVTGCGTTASISATGAAVPASADYQGINVGGTLRGQTGVNPSGTVYATQIDVASVAGTTAATANSGVLKVGITGSTAAAMDFAGQNAATPGNALLIGCQFNTTPTTITSGNASPCQLNSAGSLLVATNDTTGSGTLGALNNTASIAMAGVDSAAFTLPSGNNLVGTLTPEYSNDGGTTWQSTYLRAPNAQWAATVAVSSTQNTYNILVPGGASNVRVRVSAYTSGTASATIRAVQQPEFIPGDVGIAGAAVPNWIAQVGGTDGTNLQPLYLDPCQRGAKTYVNINQTAGTQLITGAASKKTYICSFWIAPIGTATNIALVEGTGVTCATATISVSGVGGGSGTAATGPNLAVNEGFSIGSGGAAVGQATVTADNVCLLQSAANQVSGGLSYVQY